jgi:polysaccharide export outer membrane protein
MTIRSCSVSTTALAVPLWLLLAAWPAAAQSRDTGPVTQAPRATTAPAAIAPDDYTIGRLDVLSITLAEEPDVSGRYTVDVDGTLAFPHVGRFKIAGLTVRQVEADLRRRLVEEALILDPHLTVTLVQFRGRRVFVFGGVSAPGMYPLEEATTFLEVLTKAGGGSASEAVIVRTSDSIGPLPSADAKAPEVIKINLRELEKDVESGVLARNLLLRDGDTIYVARVDRNRVFVSGEVKTPGAYSVPDGTTVLELLSLSGGVTEGAAVSRIKIIRIVDNKQTTMKASLTTVVRPGDTIIVPLRFF